MSVIMQFFETLSLLLHYQ